MEAIIMDANFWYKLFGALCTGVSLYVCLYSCAKYWAAPSPIRADLIKLTLALLIGFTGYNLVADSVAAEKADNLRYEPAAYLASSDTAVFFEDDNGKVLSKDVDGNSYSQACAYMFMYDTKGTSRENDDELIAVWQTIDPREELLEDY
jgi:hypothetical protein